MPLRNELFGVFKIVEVKESNDSARTQYIVSSASKDITMDAKPMSYIQGTPETRILDIGLLGENISVEAPILVGGGASIDGRSLLLGQIANAAKRYDGVLPILATATLKVSADSGATVSLTLKSDGNLNDPTFVITDPGSAPDQLNPLTHERTRVARNYDFKVQFGSYTAYVQEASVTVTVELGQGTQFLIPYTGGETDMGTQYPYLGVAGITITGEGTAAVIIGGTNDPQVSGGAGVTLQSVGKTISETQEVKFLFGESETDLLDGIDISKTVINKTKLNATNKLITVNFGFTSWVNMS